MENLTFISELPTEVLSCLQEDLKQAYEYEKQKHGEDWSLLHGHGVAEQFSVPLQITYYASPFYFLKTEAQKKTLRSTYRIFSNQYQNHLLLNSLHNEFSSLCFIRRAFITLQRFNWQELLPKTSQLLPEDQRSDKEIWKDRNELNEDVSVERTLCFSLELYPPIPMSVHFHWLSGLSLATSSGYKESNVPVHASLLSLLTNQHENQNSESLEREYSIVSFFHV